MKYFLVFLIKVSFFSCFYRLFVLLLFTWLILCFFVTFDSIKMIFIYISVSAATGSGSGMYFQAPMWDIFLPLFDCPHGFFFHFSLFCWFNLFWSFSIYISVSAATCSGSGMGFSFVFIFYFSIKVKSFPSLVLIVVFIVHFFFCD